MASPSILNVKDFGAVGDGCADDTGAIQDAVDALDRWGAPSDPCLGTPGSASWAPYPAALYFPAGIYRITGRITIGFQIRHARIFGDGARGGGYFATGMVPLGTVIRQDTDDEPIFKFQRPDSFGWTIERLGFDWKTQQSPPHGWTMFDTPEERPAAYTSPGAVAVLFGLPAGGTGDAGYWHGRITDCTFFRGWRGVAVDDSYTGGILSLWNTDLERLNFHGLSGAAISLWITDLVEGDPSNAIRNIFVENYFVPNQEAQIRLYGQSGATLDNIDLEGSKTRVLRVIDSNLDITNLYITNLYIEHVEIPATSYPTLLTFYGGRHRIHGLNVDGSVDADDTSSAIITAGAGTEVIVSGVIVSPHDPSDPDPNSGGFTPLNGDAALFGDGEGTCTLLDRARMPVYPGRMRDHWAGLNQHGTYDALHTYRDDGQTPPRVRVPDAKATGAAPLPAIPAGGAHTLTFTVPGAYPGDAVRLGPPPDLPAGLLATGVATVANTVEVRLFNPTSGGIPAQPARTWTILAGGGPQAGAPQPL